MSKQRVLFYILFALAAGVFGFSYVYFVPNATQSIADEDDHYRKEREILIQKAEAGDPDAQYMISKIYRLGDKWTDKNASECFYWTKRAAESGVIYAQRVLGDMYQFGICTGVNHGEVVKWYQKAADQNDPLAQNSLALIYSKGDLAPKNLPLSFELFKKSAEQTPEFASASLARAYEQGIGTQRDLEKARYWYLKAKEINPSVGYESAIARTYIYSSPPDFNEGMKWLQSGMDQKKHSAYEQIGELYFKGIYFPKDYLKAGEYYKLASDNGSESAKAYISKMEKECLSRPNELDRCLLAFGGKKPSVSLKIATIYRNQKNETEYRRWLLESVSSGNKRAQLMMAVDYANGYGVAKNNIEAYAWYRVASSGLADPLVKSYAKVFNSLFLRMSAADQAQARQLAQQRILSSIK